MSSRTLTPASDPSSELSETSFTYSLPNVESGNATPRLGTPSSKDMGTVYYRSILESANMHITEGFLQSHPQLHPNLKTILRPAACLPDNLRAQYSQLMKVDDGYFYEKKPEYLHPRQVEAINYLFVIRPQEMHFDSISGGTESMRAKCTKHSLFLALFDPNSEMRVLSKEVALKFPNSLGKWAQYITDPKSDLCFGSKLNLKRYDNTVYSGFMPSIFSPDNERVQSLFNTQEFIEVSCGTVGLQFVFPTLAIVRKSDSGSYYFAQNQLLGVLRCIVEAQLIAKRRVNKDLPVLALGLVNVGNWVELWACWPPKDTNEDILYAWHISDHGYSNQWVNAYQKKLHDSIMNKLIAMDMPSSTITKHNRSDELDDNGGHDSKRVAKGNRRATHPTVNKGISEKETEQQQVSSSSAKDSIDHSYGNTNIQTYEQGNTNACQGIQETLNQDKFYNMIMSDDDVDMEQFGLPKEIVTQ